MLGRRALEPGSGGPPGAQAGFVDAGEVGQAHEAFRRRAQALELAQHLR